MRLTSALLFASICLGSIQATAQLSANSGISTSDTWVTFDLTLQVPSATLTFSQPVFNPFTGTSSNTVTLAPPAQAYHMEVGYDANGGQVLNMFPSGTQPAAWLVGAANISAVRFANGRLTMFDRDGNAVPVAVPPNSNIPANWPFNLLGNNPGSSLTSALVVPNLQARAAAINATLNVVQNSATLSSTLPGGGNATWAYAVSGSNWVAQQATMSMATPHVSGSQLLKFANVRWNSNSSKDAARIARGLTAVMPPQNPQVNLPAAQIDPAFSPGPNVVAPPCDNTSVYHLGGSQNVVLQHGIWSSACAWTRMANWLNQDFRINNEIIPSLSSNSALDSQGRALINQIKSVGGTNYILMGHSQGGLVSRWAAQQVQNDPATAGLVSGVVTVDTPHQGANLTLNLPVALSAALIGFGADVEANCSGGFDCAMGVLMQLGGAAMEPVLAGEVGSISWSQLQPGSTFLSNLNGNPEYFKQAAVASFTDQRFPIMRTIANFVWKCNPEDPDCGEDAVANYTLYSFYAMIAAAEMLELVEPSVCGYSSALCTVIQTLEAMFWKGAYIMAVVNFWYDVIIDYPASGPWAGTSDAIVQGPSQFYPYQTSVTYQNWPAHSHTGALRSSKVHDKLTPALISMSVPSQGTCGFSVSGSPYNLTSSGGNGSFAVSAASGCNWSAVSQSTWISVTAGVNGSGNGSVTFYAGPNPSTAPRVGYINVGNGNNMVPFQVTENALCTYSLSQAAVVAIPASGASSAVQVNTQQNCVWSAASNAGWLTINNSSGTGPGSFTWVAAANTTNSGRTGTIAVADQVLTIVDGDPAGTPGTATVNIQGSPQTLTFDPCAGNHYPAPPSCPQTIMEGGAVSIKVGGTTFTQGYANTAMAIANNLASQMNSSPFSPVTAAVSGSSSNATVTIHAAVNGANTNYPLSVSGSFGPQCGSSPCFTSPAFIAVPSGPQLTGGSD